MSKASQVIIVLQDKIKRISSSEFKKANPAPKNNRFKPYSLPPCVDEMVKMIGECSDERTTDERLDEIYQFATTGEVKEKAFAAPKSPLFR